MRVHTLLLIVLYFVFSVTGYTQNIQLVLGNPSNAVADENEENNFLLKRNSFVLSCNRSRGASNWVSWHLQDTDLGDVDRTNAFRADTKLPVDWRITKADYNNSGYSRGHMCPSEERSKTETKNRETFYMSNMHP